LKDVLDSFELTDGRLLGITTDNGSSNYSMTRELQSTLEASGIEFAGIEEPHTMHGARHTAGFRCIHEQSQCKNAAPYPGKPMSTISNLDRMNP